MTARYSIRPDKVSEAFEKYSDKGDLSLYVQTATGQVFKVFRPYYPRPQIVGFIERTG